MCLMTQHCILIIAACYLRSRKYKKFTYYWSVKDLVQILGWKDVNFPGSRQLSLVWNLERKLYLSRHLHTTAWITHKLGLSLIICSRQSCPSAFPFPAFMLIFGVSFLFFFFWGKLLEQKVCPNLKTTDKWMTLKAIK